MLQRDLVRSLAVHVRRRDGEVYVDLPLDIAGLVEQKLHDRAVAEYAKRYDLPPERARRVIDAHR